MQSNAFTHMTQVHIADKTVNAVDFVAPWLKPKQVKIKKDDGQDEFVFMNEDDGSAGSMPTLLVGGAMAPIMKQIMEHNQDG